MVLFYIVAFWGFFGDGYGKVSDFLKVHSFIHTPRVMVSIAADSKYPSWLSELSNSFSRQTRLFAWRPALTVIWPSLQTHPRWSHFVQVLLVTTTSFSAFARFLNFWCISCSQHQASALNQFNHIGLTTNTLPWVQFYVHPFVPSVLVGST